MKQHDKTESVRSVEKAEQPRPARRVSIAVRRLEKLETTGFPTNPSGG